MSIQHALLTSLLEKPSTGLGLAHRFDRSIGYFWQATHQQIYRELARMVRSGWVKVETERGGGRRRRKVYHVLPAGRQELARWVGEVGAGDDRRAFLVKVRAEAVLGTGLLGPELERLVLLHRQRLTEYRRIEQRDFSAPRLTRQQRLQYAVLRGGILQEEAWLRWAAELAPLLAASAPLAEASAASAGEAGAPLRR